MQQLSHRRRRRVRGRGLALAAVLCFGTTGLTPVDYDRYRDHDELTRELRRLSSAHRASATLVSIGETREGRDIWALEVAAPGAVAASERPALLVVGTLEGDRVIGSELALYLAEHLLTAGETDAAVREQLERHAFYIVPRLNPDGAERMFARVRADGAVNATPRDGDVDGRVDEDGPEDLNGDGLITLMRVPEPGGPFMVHPDEPRLMKRADASRGEAGSYRLYVEGVDSDGDGFFNEDGPGGVDLDRNFQHAYPYYAADAGPHMVSERETRALMDYVLAHRNIAAVLTFGGSDNLVGDLGARGEAPGAAPLEMLTFVGAELEEAREVGMVERPRSRWGGGQQDRASGRRSGRQPATTVAEADREYYRTIAERYRELTGIEAVANTRAPAGAFHDFAYFQFGVPGFSTPGWGIDAPSDAPGRRGGRGTGEAADARMLAWMDAAGIDGFVAWEPFDHPELGPVEIGGFRPYATTNPPADRLAELGASHAEFALYLASLFPAVRIAETDVTAHGGGLYEVAAVIENRGYLPTALAQGVTARAVAPVMVQLGIEPDALITGDAKTSFLPSLDGSGSRESYSWLVRGRRGQELELKVVSQKAGSETATLTLR
ncbi:MAG: M14 family metallopeptidase [Gemmatimonadota bacterium]